MHLLTIMILDNLCTCFDQFSDVLPFLDLFFSRLFIRTYCSLNSIIFLSFRQLLLFAAVVNS